MIKLIEDKNNKKHWNMIIKNDNNNDIINLDLNLIQSSILNRFDIIKIFFKDICKTIPEFSNFFYNLVNKYIKSKYDSEIVLNQCDRILKFAEKYVDLKKIDFSSFVNVKKASKSSILFYENDIKSIAIATTAMKIYCIFYYDVNLKVSENIHKNIYNKFIQKCKDNKTIDKIFHIIRARTYRSSISDRFMWDLIKMSILDTPDTNIMSVFNFFMNNLFILLDISQNPVHFIIKISEDNLRWVMLEIYKEKIIFDEAFGSSEDIHGTSISKDSFYIYCCNDVVSKCANLGMKILETEYNLSTDDFINVRDRLESVKFTDPIMRLFTIPIISKILDIPYTYLLTTPPKHLILISLLIFYLAKDTKLEKFPVLYQFLTCYPEQSNSCIVSSSYKIRDIDTLIEDNNLIFGINSRKLKYELLSPICGILSISKRNLLSIVDGEKINKITYTDLELDAISFYISLYNNSLNETFTEICDKINQYF